MDMSRAELTQKHGSQSGKRRRTASSQKTATQRGPITTIDDVEIMKTKKRIGRILYKNGVDVDDADVRTIQRIIPHFSQLATSEIPSREELKGWIFQDAMDETRAYEERIKSSWVHTGCSILLDGWIDTTGRNLVNVLVDCPKGTVYLYSSDVTYCMQDMDAMMAFLSRAVTTVGYENVVQVITSSTSGFMKKAGKQLMEKFPSIFWAVSASDCLQLMLEKMETIRVVKHTLKKAKSITRFILSHPNILKSFQDETNVRELVNPSKMGSVQQYITLEDLVSEKDALMRILNSSSALGKEGRGVAKLVRDWSFWGDASTVLKGVFPLVRVMEWLNEGNKDQIGVIYETMDQVKETIKQGFRSRGSNYKRFWKVIDGVWNKLLYSPLHAAGYFLNPTLFYSDDFVIDPEVATGLCTCVIRSSTNHRVQVQVTKQLESYGSKKGAFRMGSSVERRSNIPPALWWSKYGTECRDLQRLAVRILSQTCDGGSKFQLRRNAVEATLNAGRDRRERLVEMLYLRYNMQLQNFSSAEVD
ncbi:hypothetical protein ACS0TY_000551 [Phlomoides rotata]